MKKSFARRTVVSALVNVFALQCGGCVLYGDYDEPAEWTEARFKVEALFQTEGSVQPLLDATGSLDAELGDAVGVLLAAESSSAFVGAEAEAADSTPGREACAEHTRNWSTAQRNVSDLQFLRTRLYDRNDVMMLSVAVIPATQVLREVRAKADLMGSLLTDEQMSLIEEAADRLTEISKQINGADSITDLTIEDVSMEQAHELTHVVQQGRSALSPEGRADLDRLVRFLEERDESLAAEAGHSTDVSGLVTTLDRLADSLNQCLEMDNLELQDMMQKQRQSYQMLSSAIKLRHDTAKAIIQNLR